MFTGLALAAAVSAPCEYRPQLQFGAAISRARVARHGKVFEATARVAISSRTVRAGAATPDPGMRAHIAGYYAIAHKLVQSSGVRAVGATQAQALARLKRTAATLARDANAEYARQILIYNTVTANGRTQSQGPAAGFPGGPNATVFCGG